MPPSFFFVLWFVFSIIYLEFSTLYIVPEHVVGHHPPTSTPRLLVSKSCDKCSQVSPSPSFSASTYNAECIPFHSLASQVRGLTYMDAYRHKRLQPTSHYVCTMVQLCVMSSVYMHIYLINPHHACVTPANSITHRYFQRLL